MSAGFRLVGVEPTGTRRGTTLVYSSRTGSARQEIDEPTYPPSLRGEQLRRLRIGGCDAGHVSLASAALVLGLAGAELSRLETGEAALESDAEWDRAERLLRASFTPTADPAAAPPVVTRPTLPGLPTFLRVLLESARPADQHIAREQLELLHASSPDRWRAAAAELARLVSSLKPREVAAWTKYLRERGVEVVRDARPANVRPKQTWILVPYQLLVVAEVRWCRDADDHLDEVASCWTVAGVEVVVSTRDLLWDGVLVSASKRSERVTKERTR